MQNKICSTLFTNKYHILLVLLLSLVITFFYVFSAAAEDYILQGDEIIFIEREGRVIFEGNASFSSADFEVYADQIEVDTKSRFLTASNNVSIISDKDELRGHNFEYNYESEKGSLYQADGSVGEIFISGSKLDILSASPVEAVLLEAEFTPCSRENPHYHFKAKEIRIHPDNTLTIHHIVPYILDVPVFYLPYYTVSYDPESEEEDQLRDTFPLPEIGYDTDKGLTVEFSYPYQIGENNSGRIYYWQAGSGEERDEIREFRNNHQLTDNLTFKNRYSYLYDYDFDDQVLDEEKEEFSTSLAYDRNTLGVEAGILRDLLPAEPEDIYFLESSYRFQNGLNTSLKKEYSPEAEEVVKSIYRADYRFQTGINSSFRQEYDSQGLIKENYRFSYNQAPVNWNLKYVDGENYNYYPYLELDFPQFYNLSTRVGMGRVENKGIELNKYRLNLNYSSQWQLMSGLSYHLNHNYRLDHYRSSYQQNYHFSVLNTGLRYNQQLNEKMRLQSSLFYQQNSTFAQSPLVDDRENEKRELRSAMSISISGDHPDSAWALSGDGIYDLDAEDWDQINLRIRKEEDCFNLFIGYEFIDKAFVFGLEL